MTNKNQKTLKVCHITSAHNRYDVRIFEKECKSLANNGYDVTLIVNDSDDDEIIDNIKIISTKYKYKNRIERILYSRKFILKKAIDAEADIYHFHDPELLPLGNRLKRIGKKVIFDSHENYTMQIKEKGYIPKILRRLISKLYKIYETYSAKNIDAVIFPCTFDNINPFENRANKTVFIDNFPILDELYSKFDSRSIKSERTICYVGGLSYSRGITHLIKAAYKVKASLVLGGQFISNEYFIGIKNMIEFSCVDYKGYVNRQNVLEIYSKSLIGICTILNIGQYNKADNFATKVYEYMSMGLPIIISDYPYAREVLKHYKFGILVDPEDINGIAEKIQYLLDNIDVATKMGQEGRRAVKERFNWSNEEQKLLKLYEEL